MQINLQRVVTRNSKVEVLKKYLKNVILYSRSTKFIEFSCLQKTVKPFMMLLFAFVIHFFLDIYQLLNCICYKQTFFIDVML